MRYTKSMWHASWKTSGPSTARKWWPRAARPFSVPFYRDTGGPTNRSRYRSKWSFWTRCPTVLSSLSRPATTRTRRLIWETTVPCRPPAWPSSTTSGSWAAAEEVRIYYCINELKTFQIKNEISIFHTYKMLLIPI